MPQNAKELAPDDFWKILFVGRQGTGKSSCAASFPGPRYCYDFDHRIQSLRGQDIAFDSWNVKHGWTAVDQHLEQLLALDNKNTPKYNSILISSVSSLTDAFTEDARRLTGLDPHRKHVKLGSITFPDLQHYRYAFEGFKQLIENGVMLFQNCHVIMEAHENRIYDFDKKQWIEKKLATIPSLQEYLPGKFNEVWEFEKEESAISGTGMKYRVRFRSDIAKTSFKQLKDSMDIPDPTKFYDQVLKAIKGG